MGTEGVEPSNLPRSFSCVRVEGIEPSTSSLSERRSTSELHAHKGRGRSTAELRAQDVR